MALLRAATELQLRNARCSTSNVYCFRNLPAYEVRHARSTVLLRDPTAHCCYCLLQTTHCVLQHYCGTAYCVLPLSTWKRVSTLPCSTTTALEVCCVPTLLPTTPVAPDPCCIQPKSPEAAGRDPGNMETFGSNPSHSWPTSRTSLCFWPCTAPSVKTSCIWSAPWRCDLHHTAHDVSRGRRAARPPACPIQCP